MVKFNDPSLTNHDVGSEESEEEEQFFSDDSSSDDDIISNVKNYGGTKRCSTILLVGESKKKCNAMVSNDSLLYDSSSNDDFISYLENYSDSVMKMHSATVSDDSLLNDEIISYL